MTKLLFAVAFTAALSTPALAVPGTKSDYRHVHSKSELPQNQSQPSNGQTNDPYWKPCHFSRYGGMNLRLGRIVWSA
jgi:hypothetical protein